MKRFITLLLVSILLVSAAAAQSTIFIVRHPEKAAAGGDNPELSEAGRVRAESLATALKDAGILSIYSTELKRTQQTAATLARRLHLEPAIIAANDRAALVAKPQGSSGSVLVVGHSNTARHFLYPGESRLKIFKSLLRGQITHHVPSELRATFHVVIPDRR